MHWGAVDATLWAHAVGAPTANDFILAAELDRVYAGVSRGDSPRAPAGA